MVSLPGRSALDVKARPRWLRTGYTYLPYAARHSGQWWVLRFNFGFAEHEIYTLFIDGSPVTDATGDLASPIPLLASICSLRPSSPETDEPTLDSDTAAAVVRLVAQYADNGSEYGDRCFCCSGGHDGVTLR